MEGEPALRFAVGDRVRCKVAPTTWAAGVVTQVHYREPQWPAHATAPYQVELDEDGQLIFAPADDDRLIRSERDFERLLGVLSTDGPYAEVDADEDDAHTIPSAYRDDVAARYPRKHPRLFDPNQLDDFLEPSFAAALAQLDGADGSAAALRSLLTEQARGLFSIRIFSAAFCEALLAECEHFEAWCLRERVEVHRPNTMNNHGAIVDDFGLAPMMAAIVRRVVEPLSRLAGYADVMGGDGGGAALLTHHAFVVSYALGKDLELGFHVDSSDVTLNLCLGRLGFVGGGLYFKGVRCPVHQQGPARPEEEVTYDHVPGVALLHRGKHRHGARRLTAGERHNLILWCRGDPARSSEGLARGAGGRTCQAWCWARTGLLSS